MYPVATTVLVFYSWFLANCVNRILTGRSARYLVLLIWSAHGTHFTQSFPLTSGHVYGSAGTVVYYAVASSSIL